MTDFRFANAELLFILLALPAIGFFLSRVDKGARTRLQRFIAEANLKQLLITKRTLKDRGKKIALWAGLALLIIAAARPQANPTVEEVQSTGLDIYVLLDVSRSMDVEDVAPSRLKKAKKTIQHLTTRLAGDRVGIIAYANSAVLITPLTSDFSIIDSYLKNIDSSIIPSQGTNLGGALEVAQIAMERGAKSVGLTQDRSNVFVIMSDGEDYGDSDISIVDAIHKNGGLIFSIAFGTERGAPIPLRDEKGELRGYKTDLSKSPVISSMKAGVLQEVASRGGGHFYFSTQEESEVEDILARVSDAQRGSFAVIKTIVYEEWFAYPLAPGIALLLFSFVPFLSLIAIRSPSWASIKKTCVRSILIPTLGFFLSHAAVAHPLSFLWTKEKKASTDSTDLAKQKKYSEAVDTLQGLQAENPDSSELSYNIGTYLLQDQKHSQGREQLSRLRSAEDHIREPALFNAGGSFALEGKKEDARAAYAELLQLLSQKKKLTSEESKLLEQTRRNIARLADPNQQPPPQQDKSKQEKQKPDDKNDGGGDGDKKKDSKSDPGDSKENKGSAGEEKKSGADEKMDDKKSGDEKKKNEEDKKNQDKDDDKNKQPEGEGDQKKQDSKLPPRNSGQPFKERDNMGEDDAKRILGALKERESNLQKKFLKDQVKGGKVEVDDAAKDW